MYRFESAFMSGTTPINGSVPFPPWGSAMKSATQRARIQKLGAYVNVAKKITCEDKWWVFSSWRMDWMEGEISYCRQARNEAAIASSKFSSSTLRFSANMSSLNAFLSFMAGAGPRYFQPPGKRKKFFFLVWG